MAAVGEALEEILRSLEKSPKRAPTPLPVPQSSPSSTTLESAAETTSPGASTSRRWRRLPLVLGSLAFAGVLAMVIIAFAISDPDAPTPQTAENRSVTEPLPGEVATAVADTPIPISVAVPIDAATEVAKATAVDATPQVTPDTAQNAVAAPNKDVEFNCLRHQKNQDWAALDLCASQLNQLNPTLATELRKQANLEIRSALRVKGLEAALDQKDLKQAKSELDQIWTGSRSYERSKLKYENLEIQVINDLVARLQLADSGNCEMYKFILANERDKNPPRVIQEATRRAKCTPTLPSECDHETLAKMGLDFQAAGRHDRALQAFSVAWDCKPEPQYAQRAFVNACNALNTEKAKLFWKRLPESMQQRALGVCIRNGISHDQLSGL